MKELINFKSEAWKYSPAAKLNFSQIKEPSQTQNIKWAIGPSPHQFQVFSLQDLCEDKIIDLKEGLYSHNTQNKDCDPLLSQFWDQSTKTEFHFRKAPPSTIWIDLNQLEGVFEFYFTDNEHYSICFFEGDGPKKEKTAILNFYLKGLSQAYLFYDLDSEYNSYKQSNVYLRDSSSLESFSLLRGKASYKRLESRVYLESPDLFCKLNGLALTSGNSSFEYHSDIFLQSSSLNCAQKYHSINQQEGHSVFKGRIHLKEASAGAQVEQINRNILLGEKSKIDTQPELNILNDDVKASHGATVGSLDPEEIFYLESRGFDKGAARNLLLKSFAKESFSFIRNSEIKNYFSQKVEDIHEL